MLKKYLLNRVCLKEFGIKEIFQFRKVKEQEREFDEYTLVQGSGLIPSRNEIDPLKTADGGDDYTFSLFPEEEKKQDRKPETKGLSAEKLVFDSYQVKGFDQPLILVDDYVNQAAPSMEPIQLEKQASIDRSHTQIQVEMRVPQRNPLTQSQSVLAQRQ